MHCRIAFVSGEDEEGVHLGTELGRQRGWGGVETHVYRCIDIYYYYYYYYYHNHASNARESPTLESIDAEIRGVAYSYLLVLEEA